MRNRLSLVVAVLFFTACDQTVNAGDTCNASTCPSGCCSGKMCVTGNENSACGTSGQQCADCGAASCSALRVCIGTASGGGSAATGGGTEVAGGGTAVAGGGTAVTGGGTEVAGGGAAVAGGGTAVSGGGTAATGGGTAVAGGGTAVAGGGTAVSGGGTAVAGGGTAVAGGGTAVAGGGTAVAGGGTAVAGGGTAVAGGGTAVTGGGSALDAGVDGGTVLVRELVAPEHEGAREPSILFDAQGILHAIYIDQISNFPRHVWRDASGWHREIIAATPAVINLSPEIQGAFDSTGSMHVMFTSVTNPALQEAVRSAQGVWTVGPMTLPSTVTQLAWPTFESDASPLGFTIQAAGSNFNVMLHRRTAGIWQAISLGAQPQALWNGVRTFPDAVRHRGIVFASSIAVENAQGAYDVMTPPTITSEAWRDAAGTIHLLGKVAGSGNDKRYVFGSGIFWSVETVMGLGTGNPATRPPQRMDVTSNGTLRFSEVVTPTYSGSGSQTYLYGLVLRTERTGTNTYMTLPSRSMYPDSQSEVRQNWVYGLKGIDPAGEPIFVSARQDLADGAGRDVTDWPNGVQRTAELDWREALLSHVDMAIDAQGSPQFLVVAGEGYYGKSRLVIRKKLSGEWVESAPVLPTLYNGNGQLNSRLQIGTDGRPRVLADGSLSTNSRGLIFSTETSPAVWARELATTSVPGAQFSDMQFVLDANGDPHVIYEERTSGISGYLYALKYTRRTSTWSTPETISSGISVAPIGRLIVDLQGQPSVVFLGGGNGTPTYSRRVSGTWQTAALTNFGTLSTAYNPLTIDAAGQTCLIHNPTSTQPVLTCVTQTGFQSTPLGPPAPTIYGQARDAQGKLHLFVRGTNQAQLLHETANGWQAENLRAPLGATLKYAISPNGDPHMAEVESLGTGYWSSRLWWRHR